MILSVDVGRKNLALCALVPGQCAKGTEDRIRHWAVTACDPTPAGIRACLGRLPWTQAVDEVVIERQPNRNHQMTRLQHYLEMYFAMHDKPVTVQDAKHKLAFAAGCPWWPTDAEDCGWTYHARKKLSVKTTAQFLEGTPQDQDLKAVFLSTSKKDDLADSLLQGMAFAHHVRPLELTKRRMDPSSRIKPRKPTAAQQASGRYPKSAIVHLLRHCTSLQAVDEALVADKKLGKSVLTQFGGADNRQLLASLHINLSEPSEAHT